MRLFYALIAGVVLFYGAAWLLNWWVDRGTPKGPTYSERTKGLT